MSDLPVNADATYDDDASDASVKLHQQHHDAIHALYNDIAGATPDLANQGIEAAGAAAAAQAAAVQRANHTGTQAQSTVTNLVSDLAAKAPLASPTFTGTPTAPTAASGTNSTQVATTAYVDATSSDLTRFIARSPLDRGVRDATGGGVYAAGTEYTLFTVEHRQTFDRILIEVKTSGANIDVGIYDDDGTAGAPGTKLASSGSVACPAAGGRAVALSASITLNPGTYYAALTASAAGGVFLYSTGMNAGAALGGIRYLQTPTVFPLPATASSLTEQTGGSAYVILAGKA